MNGILGQILHCKAILGWHQPGLMIKFYESLCRIDCSTCWPAVQFAIIVPRMPPVGFIDSSLYTRIRGSTCVLNNLYINIWYYNGHFLKGFVIWIFHYVDCMASKIHKKRDRVEKRKKEKKRTLVYEYIVVSHYHILWYMVFCLSMYQSNIPAITKYQSSPMVILDISMVCTW